MNSIILKHNWFTKWILTTKKYYYHLPVLLPGKDYLNFNFIIPFKNGFIIDLIKNKQTTLISLQFLFVQTSSFMRLVSGTALRRPFGWGAKRWGCSYAVSPHLPQSQPPDPLVIFTSPNLRAQTSQRLLPAEYLVFPIIKRDELPSPCTLSTGFLLSKPYFSR